VQAQLAEALKDRGVVIYNGDMNPTQKQAAVESFQSDPSIQFFIGTIMSCGVGITLTAASYECFAELEWTPADLDQAEDRAYRQGQKNAVLVHHVVFDGSLDDKMLLSILGKQRVCKATLDDVHAPRVIADDTAKLTRDLQRAQDGPKAPGSVPLPQEKIEPLRLALRLLAGMCDGARTVDGSGFNKMDSNFGKSLATQSTMSPLQAAAAHRMVRKYKKQLPSELYEKIYG